jgi:Fe-S-cluster containining protein
MRDGALRRALKWVARWNHQVNLGVTRAILERRGLLFFDLGGSCRGCAQCCEAPGIQVGWLTWYFPSLRALFLAWQRHVNGFVLTHTHTADRVFIFACTHFDKDTRRCDSYESRPGMCRDYPRALLHHAAPDLMPGCGHHAVARGASNLLAILEEQPMTAEQRQTLKQRLHLEK